jgi:hypothetical protein
MRFRKIAQAAILILGTALAGERWLQAWKSFQNWRFSLRIGDTSGAAGWRAFATEQFFEGLLAFSVALGFFFWLRSARVNPP